MSKPRFEFVTFTASEAEGISRINGESQRNLRRHGYLPGVAGGWNRYSIEDLAASVADGDEVDWVAKEGEAGSDGHRRVLRELRVIAGIAAFCRTHFDHAERVFDTLDYFDAVNFAARAQAPALFSAGLMDAVCPPSTIFAAYNHYAGPKDIRVWPHHGHDGPTGFRQVEHMRFVRQLMA